MGNGRGEPSGTSRSQPTKSTDITMTLIASKIALPETTALRAFVPTRKPSSVVGRLRRRPSGAVPRTPRPSRDKGRAGTLPTPLALPISVPRSDVEPPPPPTRERESRGLARDGELNLRRYLREISDTPLLTVEEEISLAARIRKGDVEARDRMIRSNLRLVVKIAKDFDGMGLPLLDMINEGNIGLMRAVERFDPRKGAKLSTYAAWWIKQAIKRALANQGKTIRLPVHLVDRVAKIRRTANRLHEELGREATEAEIAEALGMTRERVTELLTASYRPASLDAPMGDDADTQLQDIVPDENSQTAYEDYEAQTRLDLLRELVGQLDDRELTIIRHRYGLDGGPERTLEEVGDRFGVTRERIRQIQGSALAKLRRLIEQRDSILDPDMEAFRQEMSHSRRCGCDPERGLLGTATRG